MTTYYKINGQYVTYQQAHDLGYTMEATADQAYKSAGSSNWGESSASSGLYDGLSGVPISGSFFVEGESGWVDIDGLALRGYFPNEAETLTMHNVNDGRESAAAKLESGGEYYYLVQADLNLGWISEDDLPETGWQEGSGSVAFCGNFTTEDDVMSSDVAGGQGYLPTYLVVTQLYESRGWAAGGNLNMAYFTSAGASATQNTELDYYESYRLYDENGNAITYRAANEEYRITSAFRVNTGSSAALWNSSYLNTWLKLQQVGQMFAYTEEESGMPSDTDIHSLMYSIYLQPIIIDLKLKSDGSAATFSANDYWYSYFRDQSDQAKATKYGMAISDDQLADSNLTSFNINILALLDSSGNNVQADLSNFSVGSGSGKVRILSTDAYATYVSFWRVYVTKEQVVYTRLMLFLRSSNYQTVNKSVTANSSNVLYAEGSDAMYTVSDLTQKYILTGAYSNTGATIDITGCKLTVLANGRLTLDWGDTAANVCYITALTEAPPSITVLLGLRYDGNDWLSKTFDADDYWWSGILSQNDKTLIESIGLRTSVMFYGYGGQIGSIEYNAGYTYQILGLYSDIDGTQQVQTDLSNLFVAPHVPTGDTKQYAAICNHTAITTPSMTWRVKITPKGTVVVAYKADGTTSNGVQNGNNYIITAVDSNWHTEAELNALGWYVQWNLYTFSAYSSLNIRNTPSLSTSYVIAKWPQTETLVGNPYLEQTVDDRVWQTVKFTLNGGATVQTGYCIVDSQVPVTHTTGTAQTDILTAENP